MLRYSNLHYSQKANKLLYLQNPVCFFRVLLLQAICFVAKALNRAIVQLLKHVTSLIVGELNLTKLIK